MDVLDFVNVDALERQIRTETHPPEETRAPTFQEINNLRYELRSIQQRTKRPSLFNYYINKLHTLSPSFFFHFVHRVIIEHGPLPSFPVLEYPFADRVHRGKPRAQRPSPMVDDGTNLLEEAATAVSDYNRLLKEKVAKFNIQSVRSLAIMRDTSVPNHNTAILWHPDTMVEHRNMLHADQIARLREMLASEDFDHQKKLKEYREFYQKELHFLDKHHTLFAESYPIHQKAPEFWDEYDFVLRHILKWKRLVHEFSPEGKAVVDAARLQVSHIVWFMTRNCHVQLETVFYEASKGNAERSEHERAVYGEAAAIVKEIEWLWEEVIPVAHMSVSAQFLKPTLKSFAEWDRSRRHRRAIVATYCAGVLRFMNDRLSAVAERTAILVYHHQALEHVAWLRQLREAIPGSMVMNPMRPSLSHDTIPYRKHSTVAENVRAFMQCYGSIPLDVGNPFPKPPPSVLDEYVQSRAQRGDVLLQDVHKLFEAAAKSGLIAMALGGDLLLDSLLADSAASSAQPGSVYTDTQVDRSIAVLREQAKSIREMFRDMNLAGPANAPDYVAYAYQQTSDRLAVKVGEDCFKGGQNPKPKCLTCIRCLKFEEFVRKWGS
ncbi:hypothetical protein F4777DRAFT_288646 [Nemania sp. FL0916]|nr:hypothetical protein F4777DRAFT_288646 [Nemania sp. FL0916]